MPHQRTIRGELASLARLAVPLAMANAGQALMGVVDTAVCGRAGAVVLAGTGLGNVIFLAVAVFGMGLMMGLDPLLSQSFGAGDARAARRLLWQGIWLALGAGALLAVPCALAPLALRPLGIDDAVATQASHFLWVRAPSLPALLLFVVVKSYLQSLGRTRAVVVATVVGNVVNFLAVVLFVFGGAALPPWAGPLRAVPPMGSGGSALATALAVVFQAGFLAIAVRAISVPGGSAGLRRPSRGDIHRAARVGMPVALHMGAEVGVFALVGFLAGRLGRAPLAAHQIAIALASFTFTVAVGIGQAGAVRVGWAVGRRDRSAARRSGLVAFGAGASFMALSGLLFLLFPGVLARLMTDDPGVLAATAPLLVVAAVFQVSDGVQAVGAGVLRGAGDTRFTFAANMVGHWAIGLPIALLLGAAAGLGVTGLWWGLCVGLAAVAVALLARFLRLSSREIAPLHLGGQAPSVRYALPQPYRDLDHTADVGVEVEGRSAEEALARLVLAQTSLLTGGVPVAAERDERLRASGADPASIAVDLLRELLFRFATERTLAAACQVLSFDPRLGAEVVVGFGRFDAERHAEGLDLKAVTRHGACLEAANGGWRARIVFDI
jgi:MATE family multidrug resistance protein